MANQIGSQLYSFQIFGDGVSTSISFDIKNIPAADGNDILQLSNPDSIYLQEFNGSPLPLPNVLSISVSGSVVTVNFDTALATFNLSTQDGLYVLAFYLGFNS